MASFCVKCGNALPKDAKFCPSCGAPAPKVFESSEQLGSTPGGPGSSDSGGGFQSGASQQVPPIPPRGQVSGQALDIFFFVPIVVWGLIGVLNLVYLGTLMKYGRGGIGLLAILLNFGLAAIIWKWPYQEYKQGNIKQARKGVMVFAGISVLLVILSIAAGLMRTVLADLAALGAILYLFYRLGNNSWAF